MSTIQEVIRENIGENPDIDVVTLVSGEITEALTVQPQSGRIYFRFFTPNQQQLDGKIANYTHTQAYMFCTDA